MIVRSEIWTHAQRTGLRPERSALDHSAILTIAHFICQNTLYKHMHLFIFMVQR